MTEGGELESFAQRFFAEPNRLHWGDIANDRLAPGVMERLNPWLDRLLADEDPIILPFVDLEGTSWYVASKDGRAFRHVREALMAMVGGSYSDYCGQPTQLDRAIDAEAALQDTFGVHVLRLRVPSAHIEIVRSRLELFANLLGEAPRRTARMPRPAGRILSDFQEALRRSDDAVASECIEELASHGYLDAANLLYLRILRDEGRQSWQEILDLAQRYHLLSASRRPRRVSQAILRAVYATSMASHEVARDAPAALRKFHESVYADYPSLFSTQAAYQCPEADVLFLMHAISEAECREDVVGAIEGVGEDDAHRPWLEALLETLPARTTLEGAGPADSVGSATVGVPPPKDPLAAAQEAFFSGDLDKSWDLIEELDPSEASAPLVIACACDVGTLAAAQHALEFFGRLSVDTREALERRKSVNGNLAVLRDLTAPRAADGVDDGSPPRVPQNWVEWAGALAANPEWHHAAAVAESGALDWDSSEFEKVESVTRFTAVLSELGTTAHARVLETLPFLISSLSRCKSPQRNLSESLELLTLIHLCDDAPGRLFFGTLADLSRLTLTVGISREGYTDLLTECIKVTSVSAGASDFDGLVELLDVFVTFPSPDPSQRLALTGTIADLFVRFLPKATQIQLVLLRQLLLDAGCEIPPALIPEEADDEADEELNPLAPLEGKSIALYSLRESVLVRVAKILNDNADNVTVTTFHDKVGGNPALRVAARSADVFVIATAAAKHAATNFIEAERDSGAVTLKPDGQGISSMLRILHEYANSLAGRAVGTK